MSSEDNFVDVLSDQIHFFQFVVKVLLPMNILVLQGYTFAIHSKLC